MTQNDILLGLVGLNTLITASMLFTKTSGLKPKSGSPKSIVLDSCALIDGRIIDIAKSGFIPEKLIIPAFIIRELQMLADGSDSHKRERARFGLDVANDLKQIAGVDVEIERTNYGQKPTDEQLLELCKKRGSKLYTTDFNLAKVAQVEGIIVLNVNALAQQLKPNFLPGEKITVKIIQKGSSHGQGVGYSDDGTMVVVDNAAKLIGKQVDVIVDRMINTVAGKMMFAKLRNANSATKSKPRPKTGFVTDLSEELR